MTAYINVSTALSITDLPPPDAAVNVAAPAADQPRSLPKVTDSGRIRFGAGYRLPTSK